MKTLAKFFIPLFFGILFFAGCTKGELGLKKEASLQNTYWKAVEIKDAPVAVFDNQREPHIVLQEDNRIVGSDGCNRMFGTYKIENESITFSHLASTRMMCAEGMEQADKFSMAFGEVKSFTLEGESLAFKDENKKVILRFVSVYL